MSEELNRGVYAGKTVHEAIEQGLKDLGVERSEVSVEILESPKSGFFGLGSKQARVKIVLSNAPAAPAVAPATAVKEKTPVMKVTAVKEKVAPPPPKAAPAAPPPPPPKPVAPAPVAQAAPAAPVAPAPRPPRPPKPLAKASPEQEAVVKDFVTGLMKRIGTDAEVLSSIDENGAILVKLEGGEVGSLIGRRGDTLDAIQHIASNIVNTGPDSSVRVHIDAADYRVRRQETLEKLARRLAAQTLKTHNNTVLEPMNAYERHIIHTALQNTAGITTYSMGSEPQRRVVIACQSGGFRRNNNSGGFKPRTPAAPAPAFKKTPAPPAPIVRPAPVAPPPPPVVQPAPVAPPVPVAPPAPVAPPVAPPPAKKGLVVKEFGIKRD